MSELTAGFLGCGVCACESAAVKMAIEAIAERADMVCDIYRARGFSKPENTCAPLRERESGSCGTRTYNLVIKSHLLYH